MLSSLSAVMFFAISAVAASLNPSPPPVAQPTAYPEHQQEYRHYTDISGPEATIISAFIGALFISIGWIVVHRTALTREREAREHADRREKEARRAELLSTLQHWLQTFVVVTDPDASKRLYYTEGMKALSAATVKFRADVADKDTFDKLNFHVSNMNPQMLDANGEENRRDTICDAIRRLTEFTRNA